MKKTYSICIANYNMSETLIASLESVLNQIDERYEVIVVDDGSADNSVEKLLQLRQKYADLRVIPLLRDSRRKLGETRNISIRAARGKYVILHIDADDIWEPYINSFAKIYHELEKRLEIDDFMLSGRQIQMATKDLLMKNPYKNIYYTEDRILWNDLAVLGKLISINHKPFFRRIPQKFPRKRFRKILKSQFSSMLASFMYTPSFFKTLKEYINRIFSKSDWSIINSTFNLIILLPCFLLGFILRRPLISQSRRNFRSLTMIDIKEIESNSIEKHGIIDLEEEEKKIYFM